MGFVEAVKTCFKKCFTFSGRASRSEFLYILLFLSILYHTVTLFLMMLGSHSFIGKVFLSLPTSIILYLLIPVLVRRLHDLNRSGWWALVGFSSIFAFIGTFASGVAQGGDYAIKSLLSQLFPIFFIILIIFLVVLMARKGTEGDNRFGPDPLQPK